MVIDTLKGNKKVAKFGDERIGNVEFFRLGAKRTEPSNPISVF